MLAYQVAQRIAWYRSLWARRVELTNALYARLMELPQLADAGACPERRVRRHLHHAVSASTSLRRGTASTGIAA